MASDHIVSMLQMKSGELRKALHEKLGSTLSIEPTTHKGVSYDKEWPMAKVTKIVSKALCINNEKRHKKGLCKSIIDHVLGPAEWALVASDHKWMVMHRNLLVEETLPDFEEESPEDEESEGLDTEEEKDLGGVEEEVGAAKEDEFDDAELGLGGGEGATGAAWPAEQDGECDTLEENGEENRTPNDKEEKRRLSINSNEGALEQDCDAAKMETTSGEENRTPNSQEKKDPAEEKRRLSISSDEGALKQDCERLEIKTTSAQRSGLRKSLTKRMQTEERPQSRSLLMLAVEGATAKAELSSNQLALTLTTQDETHQAETTATTTMTTTPTTKRFRSQ